MGVHGKPLLRGCSLAENVVKLGPCILVFKDVVASFTVGTEGSLANLNIAIGDVHIQLILLIEEVFAEEVVAAGLVPFLHFLISDRLLFINI